MASSTYVNEKRSHDQQQQEQQQQEDYDDDAQDHGPTTTFTHTTFHPDHITLSTFRRLLGCYSHTVQQVHRSKALAKAQTGSRSRAKSAAGSSLGRKGGKRVRVWGALLPGFEIEGGDEEIQEQVDAFWALDCWRYVEMPGVVAKWVREGGLDGKKEDGESVFGKDELVRGIEWKLKHGVYRPTLMGMVKSNSDHVVRKAISTALTALQTLPSTKDPLSDPDEAFPKDGLDAFGPVRGVGVATASLILSILTGPVPGSQSYPSGMREVPFFSDDVFVWLCLGDFPEPAGKEGIEQVEDADDDRHLSTTSLLSGLPRFKRPNIELKAKYNMAEYRQLWESCWRLHGRLNRAGKAEGSSAGEMMRQGISHLDIERVAFVVRNISVSGFFGEKQVGPGSSGDGVLSGDGSQGQRQRQGRVEDGETRREVRDLHTEQMNEGEQRLTRSKRAVTGTETGDGRRSSKRVKSR